MRLSVGRGRPLQANDDAAEKEANRQQRRSSLHARRCSFAGQRDENISSATQKLTNESLSALYSSTIKMLQDNKINAKNSWSLNLLDHIDAIVDIHDNSGSRTNFQLAGCTLDAGARIYSHRVDSVHNNVYKVRGGLLLGNDDEQDEEDAVSTENIEGGDAEPKKLTRKANKSGTLETNIDNITSTKVEMDCGVDLLFQKVSAAFDEGGARGMLLNTLCIGAGCEIIFDSSTVLDEAMVAQTNNDEDDERLYDLGEVGQKLLSELSDESKFQSSLCPAFTAFRDAKLSKIESSVDVKDANAPNLSSEVAENDFSFEYADRDFDASGPEPLDAEALARERLLMASIREDEELGEDAINAEGQADVGTHLSTRADVILFDADAIRGWAGPGHWRYRGGAGPTNVQSKPRERRPRGKTAALLDFNSEPKDIDFAAEFRRLKGGRELSKASLEKMKDKKNILPEDLHYKTVNLTRLFIRPDISILLRKFKNSAQNQAELSLGDENYYDFDNDCDNENFCPAVGNDEAGGGSLGGDYADLDLDLVKEPDMVEKNEIKYATTAKKLDVKLLKDSLWSDLCEEGPTEKHDSDIREDGVNRSLQEVVEELPNHLPGSELQEVSISYIFICLLHLANEKGLRIEGSEDLSDLSISVDTEIPHS
eukprot:Plantae.Rhodophyta-Purpureofilum_apyrenoidigerum.ctg29429.p1 GENE.Plantae.Rhodophyta-Purpureofilum_apyrenoidigerum.ctg29429~~Plantae.Rhodophyta-Purpureofilum_apyrenoidigerum.ctg29429.p1  ORF type:complete len:654 (-),score=147.78 Plantae.Rhodophyta-Purpureofilum_apyrenoidigerum.ctg29429:206-2167(-)